MKERILIFAQHIQTLQPNYFNTPNRYGTYAVNYVKLKILSGKSDKNSVYLFFEKIKLNPVGIEPMLLLLGN